MLRRAHLDALVGRAERHALVDEKMLLLLVGFEDGLHQAHELCVLACGLQTSGKGVSEHRKVVAR